MLRWDQGGCGWWRSYRCEGEELSVGEGRVRGRIIVRHERYLYFEGGVE